MMGLGYIGSSSSSSSNLSPLAPPFTVDRSNHNKHALNSNPVSNFNDPSYAFSQSTGLQDFFPDSSTTTNEYGYIVSEPVVSTPITHNWGGLSSNGSGQIAHWSQSHWSAVNPSPKRVDDSLFYNINEAKLFDHSYAVASSVNVDDIPLVSFNDETDYSRKLSGLEYNPISTLKQEGVSSRLSLRVEKPVEGMENGDSLFVKEAHIGASFAYNKCLNQGAYGTETLSKGKDDSSMLYYADMIRIANNNGKSSSDGTSLFANNQCLLDSHELDESHFRAFPVYSESHPLPIQLSQNPFGNSQKLTTPYEKRYNHMFEDHMIKPTKKSSSIVIKSPAAAVSAVSSSFKSLEIANAAGVSSIPQLSLQMGTTDASSSSIEDTKVSSVSDQLIFEFKAKPSSLQVPDINIPDAANSLNQHNPAEDSPCWKGTPFLPFGSPQTHPSTNKLQKGIDLQETDCSYDNHEKTSSSPIPFHNDTGEVVDSLKVRDGGDDAIKPNEGQTSKVNLPNLEEAAILPAEINGEAADKKWNTSALVNALYALSDLLLRACSNEALNEHDHQALDHVTRNLGVCMSRVQVAAASTNKLISPPSYISQESQVSNGTSGTLQDGKQHAHYQKMKFDVCGESVKNSRERASVRDLDSPEGDHMVQAIKKILDENLECEVEVPSETTLLYKNLWLEAEAELCSLSLRARFERLKRETQKETPHKSTAMGDRKETLKGCSGSTFLTASKVSKAQHIDDIINVHGEQSPVKEVPVAGVKVTGSGVTVQHQLRKDDGVDSLVIARLNTLKHRRELNATDLEERACGKQKENHFQYQAVAVESGSGSDWEHILKDEVSWRLS